MKSIKVKEINAEIEKLQEYMLNLNRDKRAGKLSESEYIEKGEKIGEQIDSLMEERISLMLMYLKGV